MTVEVGTTELVPIDRVLGFTQWVAYATFAEKQAGRKANDAAPTQPDGNPMTELETQIAILTYKFPGDTGAIETRRITQTGSALDPVESNNSGWTIKDPAATVAWALRTTVHPFERVYFASFKEDRRL